MPPSLFPWHFALWIFQFPAQTPHPTASFPNCWVLHLLPPPFLDSHFTDKPQTIRFAFPPPAPLSSLCSHLYPPGLVHSLISHPQSHPTYLKRKPLFWPAFPVSPPPTWAFLEVLIFPVLSPSSACWHFQLPLSGMSSSFLSIWWNCPLSSLPYPHPNLQAQLGVPVWGSIRLTALVQPHPVLWQCPVHVCLAHSHQVLEVSNCVLLILWLRNVIPEIAAE